MTTRTIVLTGARGGHGTTTVAAALALFTSRDRPTMLVSADATATASLIGVPLPMAGEWAQVTPTLVLSAKPAIAGEATTMQHSDVVVIDVSGPPAGLSTTGEPPTLHEHAEHYVVLRGPCYVALAGLVAAGTRPDGIILVAEPHRSLTARDVTEVLDVPVVATVDASPAVARSIDSGLLVTRLARLTELARLRPLATNPFAGRPRPSTAHPCQPTKSAARTHTDLPLSQSDSGAEGSRAVKRVALCGPGGHVEGVWDSYRRRGHAEHRSPRARSCRLLPR